MSIKDFLFENTVLSYNREHCFIVYICISYKKEYCFIALKRILFYCLFRPWIINRYVLPHDAVLQLWCSSHLWPRTKGGLCQLQIYTMITCVQSLKRMFFLFRFAVSLTSVACQVEVSLVHGGLHLNQLMSIMSHKGIY